MARRKKWRPWDPFVNLVEALLGQGVQRRMRRSRGLKKPHYSAGFRKMYRDTSSARRVRRGGY